MTLGEIIQTLELYPRETPIPLGFGNPGSYWRNYTELGFESLENTTIGAMLDACTEALGSTYAPSFTAITLHTPCHISLPGWQGGEELGPTTLRLMLLAAGAPL